MRVAGVGGVPGSARGGGGTGAGCCGSGFWTWRWGGCVGGGGMVVVGGVEVGYAVRAAICLGRGAVAELRVVVAVRDGGQRGFMGWGKRF